MPETIYGMNITLRAKPPNRFCSFSERKAASPREMHTCAGTVMTTYFTVFTSADRKALSERSLV